MHEAMLYEKLNDHRVRCRLCAHGCTIAPGERGICQVRINRNGILESLVYGRVVARDVDPIEKKPLYHVYPGTRAYSIASVGCNFSCLNCQNHFISQYPKEHHGNILGDEVTADELVADAVANGCHSMAYTYTEPTIAIEFVLEVMECAEAKGLANLWVTNGYFTAQAADVIVPHLQAANIDLKGISDHVYHDVAGANVRPVLNTIERLWQAGVWVEVTTLVIPDINDSDEALRWTAEAVRGISPAIPWHISRFFPAYRLANQLPTPIERLETARRIGQEVGLQYIYLGNLPGEGEDTICPECGAKVITRAGFRVREHRLLEGKCPACGNEIPGVWFASA